MSTKTGRRFGGNLLNASDSATERWICTLPKQVDNRLITGAEQVPKATPMLYDILAAQSKYGTRDANLSATTYTMNGNTVSDGTTTWGAAGVYSKVTIWDTQHAKNVQCPFCIVRMRALHCVNDTCRMGPPAQNVLTSSLWRYIHAT